MADPNLPPGGYGGSGASYYANRARSQGSYGYGSTTAPTTTTRPSYGQSPIEIQRRKAQMEAQRRAQQQQAQIEAQRRQAEMRRQQYLDQMKSLQDQAAERARMEAQQRQQAMSYYGGENFRRVDNAGYENPDAVQNEPRVWNALRGGANWLTGAIGDMAQNYGQNFTRQGMIGRTMDWLDNPASARTGNIFAPGGNLRNMMGSRPERLPGGPEGGFQDEEWRKAHPGYFMYREQYPTTRDYDYQFYENDKTNLPNYQWEREQYKPGDEPWGSVGIQETGYGDGGYGGGSYPSYDYGGYPSYDYPEPVQSWYENMLQWNIS